MAENRAANSAEPTPSDHPTQRAVAVTARQVVARAYGDPGQVITIEDVELAPPGPGQVRIAVQAIGVNPLDTKVVRGLLGADPAKLPGHPGLELAGTVSALGPDTDGIVVGDPVLAYPVTGAYTDHIVVDTAVVYPRPATLDPEHAAGLLLAGVTAADTVETAAVGPDDVVVIHGAAGAVGVIATQLARQRGATVIATAAEVNHDHLRSLGAIPVVYGTGLLERITAAAPGPVTAAIDTVGTDEAIDTSLALVADPGRIVSIAAFGRTGDGIVVVNGSTAASKQNRAAAIGPLIAAASEATLVTEVAATYPLTEAATALDELLRSHPRGKFVLIP